MAAIFMGESKAKAGSINTIEFNETEITASNGYLMRTKVEVSRAETTPENPNEDSLGAYQDTGPDRVIVTIVGEITSPQDVGNVVRQKLRSFMLRDQTIPALPYGQMGFELDSHPEYSINPNKDRGAIMIFKDVEHDYKQKSILYFTVRARVLGDRGMEPGFGWT